MSYSASDYLFGGSVGWGELIFSGNTQSFVLPETGLYLLSISGGTVFYECVSSNPTRKTQIDYLSGQVFSNSPSRFIETVYYYEAAFGYFPTNSIRSIRKLT